MATDLAFVQTSAHESEQKSIARKLEKVRIQLAETQ
jgi:hypothetical protein